RLTEVASQSVTFVKPALRKAKTNTVKSINQMDGPSGHYRPVFSLDRPPLLAVMRKKLSRTLCAAVTCCLVATALLVTGLPVPSQAASHREAPLLAMDPTVDSTDFFAFRSYEQGREGFVTMIADYIPSEIPPARPNYLQLDTIALYEIK